MRQHNIFVNLHKGCGKRMPVTFRNAVLLNAAKLIVSDRSDPRDEQMYAGLIYFTEVAEIADGYRALRHGNWPLRQQKIHEDFRVRFDPLRLFEGANIYGDWKLQKLESLSSQEATFLHSWAT